MSAISFIINNKNITPRAKIIFSEIVNLSKKKGFCFANNEFFAKKFDVTKRSVQKWLEQLKKENLIKIEITYKENKKWVDQRNIFLTEKAKQLLNFKNKTQNDTTTNTNIKEPLKNECIEVLNNHFDNKLNNKEISDVLKALSFKKIDNIDYLKEKLEVLKNAKNINSPIGFLIKAIMENIQPSKIKPKKENGLNVHTRHHEIEQSYRKYTEEELENMLRTNKKNSFDFSDVDFSDDKALINMDWHRLRKISFSQELWDKLSYEVKKFIIDTCEKDGYSKMPHYVL